MMNLKEIDDVVTGLFPSWRATSQALGEPPETWLLTSDDSTHTNVPLNRYMTVFGCADLTSQFDRSVCQYVPVDQGFLEGENAVMGKVYAALVLNPSSATLPPPSSSSISSDISAENKPVVRTAKLQRTKLQFYLIDLSNYGNQIDDGSGIGPRVNNSIIAPDQPRLLCVSDRVSFHDSAGRLYRLVRGAATVSDGARLMALKSAAATATASALQREQSQTTLHATTSSETTYSFSEELVSEDLLQNNALTSAKLTGDNESLGTASALTNAAHASFTSAGSSPADTATDVGGFSEDDSIVMLPTHTKEVSVVEPITSRRDDDRSLHGSATLNENHQGKDNRIEESGGSGDGALNGDRNKEQSRGRRGRDKAISTTDKRFDNNDDIKDVEERGKKKLRGYLRSRSRSRSGSRNGSGDNRRKGSDRIFKARDRGDHVAKVSGSASDGRKDRRQDENIREGDGFGSVGRDRTRKGSVKKDRRDDHLAERRHHRGEDRRDSRDREPPQSTRVDRSDNSEGTARRSYRLNNTDSSNIRPRSGDDTRNSGVRSSGGGGRDRRDRDRSASRSRRDRSRPRRLDRFGGSNVSRPARGGGGNKGGDEEDRRERHRKMVRERNLIWQAKKLGQKEEAEPSSDTVAAAALVNQICSSDAVNTMPECQLMSQSNAAHVVS